jgi:CHAT domain-containing protein
LRSAIDRNEAGDSPKAAQAALEAANLFGSAGNLPGRARSLFEFVYALDRQAQTQRCLGEGDLLRKAIAGRSYRWIAIQLSLEMANCSGKDLQYANSWGFIARSVEDSGRFHYPGLYLRSIGIRAAFDDSEGRLADAASEDVKGLNLFWQGSYPGVGAQKFYSDLGFVSRARHHWDLDEAFERESLAVLEKGEHVDLAAYAHFYAGTSAKMLGKHLAARQELAAARALFHQLGNQIYEADAEIALAELESQQGKSEVASQSLRDKAPRLMGVDNMAVQLRLSMAQARIEQREKHVDREKIFLEHAVEIGDKGFRQISSEAGRWNWREKLKEPYLRLIALELQSEHDVDQALADWEAFQEIASPSRIPGPPVLNLQAETKLQERIRQMHHSTLVAYAAVPEIGMRVWVADDRGTREISANADPRLLEEKVERFRNFCSDPHSSLTALESVSQDLYGQLIGPIERLLDKDRLLLIESDEPLRGMPWSALITADRKYAGEVYDLQISPGILFDRPEPPATDGGRIAGPLIAVPGDVTFRDQRLPSLARAGIEAASIFEFLPPAIYLKGSAADRHTILKYLPEASIFHFAGHAVDAGGHGAELLLSGEAPNVLSAADLNGIYLPHCKLVVLAACSTVAAEGDITRNPNGLVRAFLNAGAETVLASHWEVDSYATAELMKCLYRNLRGGSGVARSLRDARRSLILEPATSLPYYWAGFDAFSAR